MKKCTEMVMPMGNGENDTMFQADPFDLAEYTKECKQVFGVTPRPYWIPIQFGGYQASSYVCTTLIIMFKGIKTVLENFASNIIFSNGLRDPYSSGGYVLSTSIDRLIICFVGNTRSNYKFCINFCLQRSAKHIRFCGGNLYRRR
ncbi:putative lysosomal Pro-Xaa carboxypeptidase [Helianthus debilis subsp. tardiflorus]